MNLLQSTIQLEDDPNYHISRLLLLLRAFADESGMGGISGLTKLAKTDFLLRYPTYLQRALEKLRIPVVIPMEQYERSSIEARMIRFKYGPWDYRYYQLINIMASKGLVTASISGRTTVMTLTRRGLAIASELAKQAVYRPWVERSGLLRAYFDMPGSRFMRFVYETFPEISTLRYGEEIL